MAELKIKADSGGGTVSFKGPATTTSNAAVQLTLPVDDGTANQYLKTDGSGALSWATVAGGIGNVVEDTTPQLGGDLDVNGNQIKGDDVQIHAADDQVIAKFHKTNSSEFHFNGSKKLEVNNTGIGVTGSITPSGGLYLGGAGGGNYLSDYEVGTWTCTFDSATNLGSYSHQDGRYVKIGRICVAWFFIRGDKGTSSSNIRIGGLPFQSYETAVIFPIRFAHGGTSIHNIWGEIDNNATIIRFFKQDAVQTDTTNFYADFNDVNANSYPQYSGTVIYQTD